MDSSSRKCLTNSRPSQLDSTEANAALMPPDQTNTVLGGAAPSTSAIAPPPSPTNTTRFTPVVRPPTTSPWSTSLQTVLDQPPSTLPYKFIAGGLLFCATFVAWAWFGQINEVGRAQGQLIPKGEVYKIHPVELGKVTHIAIKEGQEVKAGQVLVELDNQIAADEVERLQQTLLADQLQLSQMQGLIERTRLEAQTRAAIAEADAQSQAAAITQSQAEAATLQKMLDQLHSDAAAQEARLDRIKPLVVEGALAKEQMFEVEQALRDRQRTITQNQGELQKALVEAERLQAGLIQKQAEGRTALLGTEQQIQQLQVEVTQLRAKIAETQNLLLTAKAKLKQRFLYAPVSGVVLSLNVQNVGEVVQPGQTIAEMAPSNAALVLAASLPNQEAGFVKPGMPVQVKLDAYPYQDYGIIPGKVIAISPDAKLDQRLGAVYRLEVALDRHSINTKNQTVKFKVGQTATADIIIRRRRIAELLLEPLRELQQGGIDL